MEQDHYKALGIREDANIHEVKRAYHAMAKMYHPDHNVGDDHASRKFREVNEAYATLQSQYNEYYKVLGVGHGASKTEIEYAYHQLSMKCQDASRRGDAEAIEKLRLLTKAYNAIKHEGENNPDDGW